MTEEELKDEICEYVHNLHKVEPFNGFSYRDLRDVAEHFALPREKRIAELETRCNELFLQTMQLSKAKEIIKTFLAIVNNDVEYVQNPQDCKDLWKELCEKAEQFLSEVEKNVR